MEVFVTTPSRSKIEKMFSDEKLWRMDKVFEKNILE